MKDLNRQAFAGLLRLLIVMAACVFLPAWSFDYWQAWVFLAVFILAALAITLYLMHNDPKLLERRIHAGPGAEKERSQKVGQSLAAVAFIALLVGPSFDHRFAWSRVPAYVAWAGEVMVALGFPVVFFVFKENTFTAAIIAVDREQKVITTGPYALVRHPMYAGALVMISGIPLALGSWWGMRAVIPLALVIVLRLGHEENFLVKNLPGYSGYREKVRYRLVPLLW